MNKNLFLLAALLSAFTMNAQNTKTPFESDRMVWYGLDFTQSRMIGFTDYSASKIKEELFREWNEVVLNEPDKFNLEKAFRKTNVYKDPDVVRKKNETTDIENLKSYNEKEITRDMIDAMVKQYKGGEKKEGVGLVFIVESFNKTTETATIHITFFDIATHKVLYTKTVTGKPGGFGTRNFWAGAISRILDRIERHDYNEWKKDVNY